MNRKVNLFDILNYTFMCIFSITFIYPFVYLFFVSISNETAITQGTVKFYPSGINFDAYVQVFVTPMITRAYMNSFIYSVLSAITVVLATSIVGYPLTQKHRLMFRGKIVFLYIVTMFISGGLIPTYLLYAKLGLVNSILVMLLPGAISISNIMIFNSYYTGSIGQDLIEAAFIDGANDLYVIFKVIWPLSKPILAVFALFTFVGTWNDFFTPLIYLQKDSMHPLSVVMRRILMTQEAMAAIRRAMEAYQRELDQIKNLVPTQSFRAASIIITILPITIIYPFLQRYFVKGIMIGSLKG